MRLLALLRTEALALLSLSLQFLLLLGQSDVACGVKSSRECSALRDRLVRVVPQDVSMVVGQSSLAHHVQFCVIIELYGYAVFVGIVVVLGVVEHLIQEDALSHLWVKPLT